MTAWRARGCVPFPSGRMHPRQVLAFGVLLATAATFSARHASPTCSPPRSHSPASTSTSSSTRAGSSARTPQNIVIGGAAGAFPPLVGWAAVTGRIDLLGDLPLPHHLLLDAAALLGARAPQAARLREGRRADGAARLGRDRDEAADAVVHADSRCRSRCLPVTFGALGIDLPRRRRSCLARVFLWGVIRVMRATSGRRRRGGCIDSSLLYLALLFAAMVVDRVIRA